MFRDERSEVTGGDGEGLPDGTVQPKARRDPKPRKLKEVSTTPGTDMAAVFRELAGLLAERDDKAQANLITAIQELNKPTAKEIREEKENEKKEERIRAQQAERLKMARAQEAAKALNMQGCSHAFFNPGTGVTTHAWRAQVHAPDGEKPFFIPTCQLNQCQIKDGNGNPVKFPATNEMLTNGVNLDKYIGLDIDRLKTWHKQATEQVA